MQEKITEIRKIREYLRYSFQDMSDELRLKKETYQGYDSGRRSTPDDVLKAAREAKKRVDKFMAGIPARVDKHQPKGCPNEAIKGAW